MLQKSAKLVDIVDPTVALLSACTTRYSPFVPWSGCVAIMIETRIKGVKAVGTEDEIRLTQYTCHGG